MLIHYSSLIAMMDKLEPAIWKVEREYTLTVERQTHKITKEHEEWHKWYVSLYWPLRYIVWCLFSRCGENGSWREGRWRASEYFEKPDPVLIDREVSTVGSVVDIDWKLEKLQDIRRRASSMNVLGYTSFTLTDEEARLIETI